MAVLVDDRGVRENVTQMTKKSVVKVEYVVGVRCDASPIIVTHYIDIIRR